jgi:hypothetical protein
VSGEMTANVFAGRRSTRLQFGFFAVSPNSRRSSSSQELSHVHKFVDDFKILFAKIHSLYGVENRPISSRNHVFCLLFIDIHPSLLLTPMRGRHRGRLLNSCRQCRYHRHSEELCLLVEDGARSL